MPIKLIVDDTDKNNFLSALLSSMTIIGIVSALFWTITSSIYTSKFLLSLKKVQDIYLKKIHFKESLFFTISYITISIIFYCYSFFAPFYCYLIFLWSILTILIIYFFTRVTILAIYYSNFFNIMHYSLNTIAMNLPYVTLVNFKNNYIKDYVQDAIRNEINFIHYVATSLHDIDKIDSKQLSDIMCKILNIIYKYNTIKNKIPFNKNLNRYYYRMLPLHLCNYDLSKSLDTLQDIYTLEKSLHYILNKFLTYCINTDNIHEILDYYNELFIIIKNNKNI